MYTMIVRMSSMFKRNRDCNWLWLYCLLCIVVCSCLCMFVEGVASRGRQDGVYLYAVCWVCLGRLTCLVCCLCVSVCIVVLWIIVRGSLNYGIMCFDAVFTHACASARMHMHACARTRVPESVKKTLLRKIIHVRILAFRPPNQRLYCSFRRWIAGHGLAEKKCLFTDTGRREAWLLMRIHTTCPVSAFRFVSILLLRSALDSTEVHALLEYVCCYVCWCDHCLIIIIIVVIIIIVIIIIISSSSSRSSSSSSSITISITNIIISMLLIVNNSSIIVCMCMYMCIYIYI